MISRASNVCFFIGWFCTAMFLGAAGFIYSAGLMHLHANIGSIIYFFSLFGVIMITLIGGAILDYLDRG